MGDEKLERTKEGKVHRREDRRWEGAVKENWQKDNDGDGVKKHRHAGLDVC